MDQAKRTRQIEVALFDFFVQKNILEENANLISSRGKINNRFLTGLAKKLACNRLSLELAIQNSCARILGSTASTLLPVSEEKKVMLCVTKINISGNKEGLINARRMLGNLAAKLNKRQSSLRTNTDELIQYTKPIYHEVIDELLHIN